MTGMLGNLESEKIESTTYFHMSFLRRLNVILNDVDTIYFVDMQ